MGRRSARVHDALGDALVVEVRDLLAENEILQQRRPAQARFQGVLIVRDRYAEVRRQTLIRRIDADTIQRGDGLVHADRRTAAARFLRAIGFGDRARADDRVGRLEVDARFGRDGRRGIVFERLVDVVRNCGGQRLCPRDLRGQVVLG
jgi:hypothetical protein